ncbi:MAG: hypothetical protein GEU79_04300 [Acidimicrobiia bacterium]|nr:hypothetical protein [Acidimicrobiia bacterium]
MTMPGLLAFHAHPDDEVISTGGVLATYAERGEQTVVITATDGAEGEIHNYDDPDAIRPRLAEVRAEEVKASMEILGNVKQEFLGYRDSGMMGEDSNLHPNAFWQANLEDAVAKLIHRIRAHRPEVMIIYDPFGGYGHPDHINVHRVGLAAWYASTDLADYPLLDGEEPWQPPKLYWTAWPRSRVRAFSQIRLERGDITTEEHERMQSAGIPDEQITCFVDVSKMVDRKIAALRAHRSQIPEDWFMLTIPEDYRTSVVGREGFVRVFSLVDAPAVEDDLFSGLRESADQA